jgi:hypothetical protein
VLLRIRVRLPDRPGSLGKVARTLGAAGADVVQMTVLESDAGRALDDFTVAWPAGVGIDRLCGGLASIPGVETVGVWPTVEPQGAFPDAALIGQLAANPLEALPILTDAVPGILSADWAALLHLGSATGAGGAPADEAGGTGGSERAAVTEPGGTPKDGPALVVGVDGERPGGTVVHTSLGAGTDEEIRIPDLRPLRARAFTGNDGTRYAVLPIAGGDLALLVARVGAPPFHRTEVFRLAQLVSAAEAVIGSLLPALTEAVAPRAEVGDPA